MTHKKPYTLFQWVVLVAILITMCGLQTTVFGQFSSVLLSRAKATGIFDEGFAQNDITGWEFMNYPGYIHSPYDFFAGNQHGVIVYAKKAGAAVTFINYAKKPQSIVSVEASTLYKNYNFESTYNEPEEYIVGKSHIPDLPLDIDVKWMAWGLPKYDDFILARVILTNPGDQTLEELRWGLNIPWQQANGFNHDQKYIWDEERKCFIFYDDRSFNWETEEVTYFEYGPGPQTGDAGDPRDIGVPNAIRHELRSPTVYTACGLVVPPDRDGNDARHYNILRTDNTHEIEGDTPEREAKPVVQNTPEQLYDKLTHEQARMSWDQAHADPNIKDGNKYERRPYEVMSFGPYDLAPGESVEIVYAYIFGQTTRDKIVQGTIENTKLVDFPGYGVEGDQIYKFAKEGIEAFWENYDAAMELINNNYQPTQYPPPTVMYKDDILQVSAEPGYNQIAFEPVGDFVDPISNTNDLAGYRIYRSNYSQIGPWELLADLSVSEANEAMENGLVVFEDVDVTLGIGYYYTVSSYDTEGLESEPVVYHQDALFPRREPGTADASETYVVPNPFRVINKLIDSSEWNRISFVNVPAQCTIRIYTPAGDLVRELEHDDGSGEKSWGSSATLDLMATRYWKRPSPGIYIYQVESNVSGHEGETFVGKFAIIR